MGAINAYQLLQRQGSIGGSWMDGRNVLESPNTPSKPEGDQYEAINRVKDDALAFVTGLFAAAGLLVATRSFKIGDKDVTLDLFHSKESVTKWRMDIKVTGSDGLTSVRQLKRFGSIEEIAKAFPNVPLQKDDEGRSVKFRLDGVPFDIKYLFQDPVVEVTLETPDKIDISGAGAMSIIKNEGGQETWYLVRGDQEISYASLMPPRPRHARMKMGNQWSKDAVTQFLPEQLLAPLEGEENAKVVRTFDSLGALDAFWTSLGKQGELKRYDHIDKITSQRRVIFNMDGDTGEAISYVFTPSGKKLVRMEVESDANGYHFTLDVTADRLFFTDIGSSYITYEAINDKWQEVDISFYMVGLDPEHRRQLREIALESPEYLKKSPAEKVKFLEKLIEDFRTMMAVVQYTSSPASPSIRLKSLMCFYEMLAELHVEQKNPVSAAEAYIKAAYLAIRSDLSPAVKNSFVNKVNALIAPLPEKDRSEIENLRDVLVEFHSHEADIPATERAEREIKAVMEKMSSVAQDPKQLARDMLKVRRLYYTAYFNYEIPKDTALEVLDRLNVIIEHSLAAAYANGELTEKDMAFFVRAAERIWFGDLAILKDPKYQASETRKYRTLWETHSSDRPEAALGLDKKELLTEAGRASALLRFETDYGPTSLKGMLKDIMKKAGR